MKERDNETLRGVVQEREVREREREVREREREVRVKSEEIQHLRRLLHCVTE